MANLRIIKAKSVNRFLMPTNHLWDKNLSLKAKGLMSLLITLTSESDTSILIKKLSKILCESEGTIKRILQELERNEYIEISI